MSSIPIISPTLFRGAQIGRAAKLSVPLTNKNDHSESIQVAIILCIKELLKYLYQKEAGFVLRCLDL
jgi:hypothetical protein